jgi:hypothetical protein
MYRIRIFSPAGTTYQGAFPTEAEAEAARLRLLAVYQAQPQLQTLAVLERYEPTRPLLARVQALRADLQEALGEVDPLVRIVTDAPDDRHRLAAYSALGVACQALAQQVYDEEGHY